jgi:peptidoglycan/xylan/chitin deacetylase (PgdA/CDA1 family)
MRSMAEHPLPVLMYHGIHSGPDRRGVYDPVYSVAPGEFARQLDWLAGNGYRSLRLRDLERARGTERCVVITFDDGEISNLDIALPRLAERGMVAEFFVTSGFVGQPGRPTAADLRRLVAAGMGVQAHGATHRYLADLDAAELEAELADSKRDLEAVIGEAVTALALPGGRGGARERTAALRLGYSDLFNSEPGVNRGWRRGEYLQRLAITRDLVLDDFARLVEWRGLLPRLLRARYHALGWAKRAVGNERYERLRERAMHP